MPEIFSFELMAKTNPQNSNRTRHKSTTKAPEATSDPDVEKKANADKPVQKKSRPKAKVQPPPKTEETNPQPQKENIENSPAEMEVHYHPQLDHKPKPLKEYLLEGFMIFIAVMMGFIAENIRETITDHEHVHHLTAQLANDLKADATHLDEIRQEETKIAKGNDTLFNLLQQPLAKADLKKIQQLAVNAHSMSLFHPSEGAINAIKNELHLKQFSNSQIISYFSRYEKHIELVRTAQEINLQYQRIYLDPFLTQHFTPENLDAVFNHQPLKNVQMRNLTQEDLTQLRTDMVLINVITKELLRDNNSLKQDVADMLHYVNEQYDLEDK